MQKKLIYSSQVVIPQSLETPSSKKNILQTFNSLEIKPCVIEITAQYITDLIPINNEHTLEELQNISEKKQLKIENFANRIISPAFINAHTHIPMAYFRGIPLGTSTQGNMIENLFFKIESAIKAEDVRAFSRMGAFENLLNGVGLVWDHYYHGQALADALLDTGLCGVVAPTLQDLHGPGIPWLEDQIKHTLTIDSNTNYQKNGIFAAIGPHATDTVSETLFNKISALSKDHSLPIHMHLAQTADEYQTIFKKHGMSPVEYLHKIGFLSECAKLLAVHCIYISNKDFTLIEKEKTSFGFCPFSQMIFNFPANISAWIKAEIPWVLGTDCVASNDSMNVQKEMRYVGGIPNNGVTYAHSVQEFLQDAQLKNVQKVAAERDSVQEQSAFFANESYLLSKVWQTPGHLHTKFKAGVIAPGYLANLLVWEPKHPAFWPGTQIIRSLAMGDTVGAIHNLMTRGNWVGEHGNYAKSILESELYKESLLEADSRFFSLLKKIGI